MTKEELSKKIFRKSAEVTVLISRQNIINNSLTGDNEYNNSINELRKEISSLEKELALCP